MIPHGKEDEDGTAKQRLRVYRRLRFAPPAAAVTTQTDAGIDMWILFEPLV